MFLTLMDPSESILIPSDIQLVQVLVMLVEVLTTSITVCSASSSVADGVTSIRLMLVEVMDPSNTVYPAFLHPYAIGTDYHLIVVSQQVVES
jgi:hypothetical protein